MELNQTDAALVLTAEGLKHWPDCPLYPHPRLGTTFFFYLLVSVLGYMALGNGVPDNVLLVRLVWGAGWG